MLVICNGAIKSGSTWLYNILAALRDFSSPDDKYLTLKNPPHPCIRPDRLRDFLETEDYVTKDFLSKNHLDKPEHRDLLDRPDVYVFDIERDARDVAVSHYYHERFRNGYDGTFEEFYWSVGRKTIASLSRYHALWRGENPRFYVSSYDRLHNDFHSELDRIAAVVGVALTSDERAVIQERKHRWAISAKSTRRTAVRGQQVFPQRRGR